MSKIIELTNSDELVLVDDEDYDYLNQWNWQLNTNGKAYRCLTIKQISITIYMAHEIAKRMNLDLTNEINHINRDPLNNKRNNLRSATRSQNSANRSLQKNNTTGYRGVSFHNGTQKYKAQIRVNSKMIYLGLFISLEDAAKAYDKAAKLYFGEFAQLNFPQFEIIGDNLD